MPTELPRRIAILVHARDSRVRERPYQIWALADVWRSWGIDVIVQRGPARSAAADVVVNHVDLTVVPEEYLRHMSRYPVAINGMCVDISKRVVSRNLLASPDGWDGPVIVKTDRNYGGEPERSLRGRSAGVFHRLRMKLSRHPWRLRQLSTHDYLVLESASAVPDDVWRNPHFVVERFLPEREGDLYALRTLTVFGGRWTSRRTVSASPVIKSGNAIRVEDVEPHADAFAAARRLHLDRGKIDYVIHRDRAIVFDANRTNTMGRAMTPERIRETIDRLAPGICAFWPPRRAESA